jgi:hypothetical protein
MRWICNGSEHVKLYHLSSDVEDCLEIKLPTAFLKEIFKRLPKQVHDHDVVHFAIVSFLITHKVKEWDESLASELVNQLALPEQHDVALHFNSFLLHTRVNLCRVPESSQAVR